MKANQISCESNVSFWAVCSELWVNLGVFIGSQPAVVLTGQKMIRQALITQAAEFAGRSDNMMVSHVTKQQR